jgi:cell wall-associated NlpC family hydrolase
MNNRAYLLLVVALGSSVLVSLMQGCSSTGSYDLTGARGEVVHAALSQVGTPYRLGGNSPAEGLDCSGLTSYAYRAAGVSIPRMAAEQQRAAKPVGQRPGPGDLVFFRSPGGGQHVGLMVDRERFVHASTSKQRVRLARLDSPYWQRHFIGAGTYIQ